MKLLYIDEGLLLTELEVTYKGKSILLKRVLVDTGSGSTIIKTDKAELIGIVAEENDMIFRISGVGGSEFVFSKTINLLKIGEEIAENFTVEIGAMDYGFDLEGIIGLDLLRKMKVIINIDKLVLEFDS